jgi:hypothetical protein
MSPAVSIDTGIMYVAHQRWTDAIIECGFMTIKYDIGWTVDWLTLKMKSGPYAAQHRFQPFAPQT